ncbi:MAG: hypothetical protein H6981_01250 [Gammaproteobacteria bacterium]|nr:hypothetical protein [Gammaproteobacteria bacterium]MCP5135412.1 hypothetical protein [Gammaproteobacteria bacterium]
MNLHASLALAGDTLLDALHLVATSVVLLLVGWAWMDWADLVRTAALVRLLDQDAIRDLLSLLGLIVLTTASVLGSRDSLQRSKVLSRWRSSIHSQREMSIP